jgi:hypothetical protein
MFHNSGGVTNLGEKSVQQSKKSSLDDDEGGVGGFNHTPYPVKPLIIMSLSFEFCDTFVMNLKP